MGAFRLFLAFAVLQSHVRSFILTPNGINVNNTLSLGVNGGYAVIFFFIVSGFLISFVLEEKYWQLGGTQKFFIARFIRIYPLWWSVWIFSACVFSYPIG